MDSINKQVLLGKLTSTSLKGVLSKVSLLQYLKKYNMLDFSDAATSTVYSKALISCLDAVVGNVDIFGEMSREEKTSLSLKFLNTLGVNGLNLSKKNAEGNYNFLERAVGNPFFLTVAVDYLIGKTVDGNNVLDINEKEVIKKMVISYPYFVLNEGIKSNFANQHFTKENFEDAFNNIAKDNFNKKITDDVRIDVLVGVLNNIDKLDLMGGIINNAVIKNKVLPYGCPNLLGFFYSEQNIEILKKTENKIKSKFNEVANNAEYIDYVLNNFKDIENIKYIIDTFGLDVKKPYSDGKPVYDNCENFAVIGWLIESNKIDYLNAIKPYYLSFLESNKGLNNYDDTKKKRVAFFKSFLKKSEDYLTGGNKEKFTEGLMSLTQRLYEKPPSYVRTYDDIKNIFGIAENNGLDFKNADWNIFDSIFDGEMKKNNVSFFGEVSKGSNFTIKDILPFTRNGENGSTPSFFVMARHRSGKLNKSESIYYTKLLSEVNRDNVFVALKDMLNKTMMGEGVYKNIEYSKLISDLEQQVGENVLLMKDEVGKSMYDYLFDVITDNNQKKINVLKTLVCVDDKMSLIEYIARDFNKMSYDNQSHVIDLIDRQLRTDASYKTNHGLKLLIDIAMDLETPNQMIKDKLNSIDVRKYFNSARSKVYVQTFTRFERALFKLDSFESVKGNNSKIKL